MRTPAVFLGLSILASLSAPARADVVVYPTGDPAQDVSAVRLAVQEGGTVLLKAVDAAGEPQAFDFGDFPVDTVNWNDFGSGYVAIGTSGELVTLLVNGDTLYFSVGDDVRLLGETVGDARTTIRGGTIPFRNIRPLAPSGGDVFVVGLGRVTIEGIRFTESALQSIYLAQLGAIPEVRDLVAQLGLDLTIEIRGNEFLDVQPAFAGLWFAQAAIADGPAGPVSLEGNAVRFTRGRFAAEQRAFEIENNVGLSPDLWEGLAVADLHGPGALRGNRVQGVAVGLHVWGEGAAAVEIADNWLDLPPEALYGIACEANHTYVIEGNTVLAPGRYPDGISMWATDPSIGLNHARVRQNHVVMDGSDFGGITLYSGGSENLFAQNVVEGSAAYALGLASPFFPAEFFSTANTIRGNHLARFTPSDSTYWGSGAHVFFDIHARDNVLVGRSGIVKDLGEGNSASGSGRRGGRSRTALPARLAEKRALLDVERPRAGEVVRAMGRRGGDSSSVRAR